MLDIKILDRYDKSGMYKIYDMWPQLAKQYYHFDYKPVEFDDIDNIVFTGMGGSGTIGNVLAAILSKKNIHVSVVKGFHLPKTADSKTLVIATSVSGSTVETLTVLDSAIKAGCKAISFSSGGKIESYSKKKKIEWRQVPLLNSPRASFPIYLYSILNVLGDIIPVKKHDVDESISQLEKTKKKISSLNLVCNPSLELAEWISGVPVIYYPFGLQAAAIRFKNSLSENAKVHAMAEDIMEACHNGIVAWESKSNLQPILIQGKDDFGKTKILWGIIEEYFSENKIGYTAIKSVDGSILSKVVNLIYLLDYCSLYRAVLSKIDPTPIRSIEFVKKRMK
ncbi:Putative glucose-6-phosphate/mannose-6-phosphate isomerase [Nitrosotalea devaniterrae]|uniref:Glucose-6-phosphate/mannose-6-phosphate isomerase n=1 Tax=Nitrosotalea devaniterrae TaxID=1078905 RepID=A0A128A0L2_9ARCH|nr:Putative glucose-6-phosphate/mannose-6-phosphate isomerase [Candidatus Nitrosotalea devanaterra]